MIGQLNKKEEINFEDSIRPQFFKHFIGQSDIKDSLEIRVQAANKRGSILDHVLLYGAPGLGKTTLAKIISNEIGTDNYQVTSGAVIKKSSDLNNTLMKMKKGGVLFIDEIHRLPKIVEEFLYPVLEDNALDLIIDDKNGDKNIHRIQLDKFTVIGATTRAGMISSPLRDRFGINYRLENYSNIELEYIIKRTANIRNVIIDNSAAELISKVSRGTPRIANRWVKNCQDYAEVMGNGVITLEVVQATLKMEDVSKDGLSKVDRKILKTMVEIYYNRPVGLSSLSSTIDESQETLETMYEPFLIQQGYIILTSRGRLITDKGRKAIGVQDE